MTETLSRTEELRNDIDNLCFSIRFQIGVLAELEELGKTHTAEYKNAERNLNALKHNKTRLEAELEAEESRLLEEELVNMDTDEFLELWEKGADK